MKRFIIRQLSLMLALVMLLTLAGVAEAPSANDADIQDIVLDGLSLDDLFIDGELEVEIDQNAGVDLTLDEITLDEIPGEVDGGSDPVDIEGIEGDVLIDEAIDQIGLDVQGTGDSTYQAHYDVPGAAPDNDALADAYLRGVLPGFGKGDRTFASPNAGRKALVKKGLTGSLAVYDALKPMIVDVAEGKRTSTVFDFDAATLGTADHWWSAADLGAASLSDPGIGSFLLAKEGIDSWGIISALLEDCPYHLYWFDKTMGWNTGCQYSTQGDTARLESLTLSFVVSADYAAGTYAVNALPARINAAVTNINKAVNDNANKGDLEKVTAYADIICGYVEYNHPAADDSSTPYGDPWQLVWIFDGDPDTKVVCEGYAKGFKYLCDLSSFDGDVGCVLPMGTMTGGTGAGRHMWNSLKMPDGRCYLVDLTNCDGGDACNYSLFLKGATGEAGGPYVCAGLRYEFDDATVSTFGAGSLWLTYSNVDYGKADAGGGDTTVNAAWSAFQKAIDDAGNNSTVTLTEDLTAGGGNAGLRIPSGKSLTLDLAGHTLDRGLKAEKNDGYVVGVEGSLTVTDSAGGGRITGGWTSTYGGGIYVDNGASLTLKGGTICGNKAFNGGGIGTPNGSITISGGVISNNFSTAQGGGVELENGKIEMTGGEITGNQSSLGGGIWLSGTFEMKGGKITDNDAYDGKDPETECHNHWGGGVCAYGADITISGGEISGNRCNVNAGNGTVFRYSDGTIPFSYAGGIYIHYGTLKMTGGAIKSNIAPFCGGVLVQDADMVMSGGKISGNTALDGGGVMIHACTTSDTASFTLRGGEIGNNLAEHCGGGLYLWGDDGSHCDNGEYIWGTNGPNAFFVMDNGIIKESTGNIGGGIYSNRGSVVIAGGSIQGNSSLTGSGIYLQSSSLNMSGGEITNNTSNDNHSGAVGMCSNQFGANEVMLSGEPIIADNWGPSGESGRIQRNLSLEDQLIYVVGPLGDKARIGVTLFDNPRVFTSGLGANGNIGAFFSDDPNCTIERSNDGNEAMLVINPTGVTLEPNITNMVVGQTLQLWARVFPGNARTTLTWNSSDYSVASVDQNGFITGMGSGTAIISVVTSNGKRAEATVNVQSADPTPIDPTGVTLEPNVTNLVVGQAAHLLARVFPENARTTLAWNSSDSSVASVDQNGFVTGMGSGTAIISVVTSNGLRAEATVNVQSQTPAQPTDPTQPTDPAQPTAPSTPTAKVKLSKCKFTVKDQVYTGKAIKAAVTVKYGKKKLKQGTDYTVAYKNNKNVGVATVTVTGKGGYTGKKTLSFKILPRKSAITKASVKGKTATLTLKRQPEATGYEVQYGLKSNFAGAKSVKVKQAKTVKATLKSLKSGKTYYARVRTYKTVGKKTYYSAWSGKKSFKVK